MDLGPSHYSPWLVESAALLGGAQAYRTAARLLPHFTGVAMSAATVRRVTQAAGATMRQVELAFATLVREAGTVLERVPDVPRQLSLDGRLIHLREEGWREVKLLAIGNRAPDGEALTALSYAATLGSTAQFADEAIGELGRRGIPGATDLVSVNDGAIWIQEVLDLHCPQAHRVLDFAHAAEYLADAAKATWADPATVERWFATQRHELLTGDPDRVLAAVAALPAADPRDTALGYLTTRRDQIAYQVFRDRGWPIGSGCVESAHQHVVQDRLKGRGRRWSRAGAEALIALRVVDANDRWDAIWPQVGPPQRTTRRARTAARRTARTGRPPRARLIVNGKPTIDHPWKQGLKRRGPRPLP